MTGERKIVGIRPPADDQAITPVSATVDDVGATRETPPLMADAAADPAAPYSPGDSLSADFEVRADNGSMAIVWTIYAGALLWIASALWIGTSGFTIVPPLRDVPRLVVDVLPAVMLAALVLLIQRRISSRTHAQQVSVLQQLRGEYDAMDDRLQAMQAHWRDADRELQSRAAALASVGLDTVARLHDAGAAIEQTMQRCTNAAAALVERSEAGQRQLDSLTIAVPRLEEITARLSENLRLAGQSAYQFGGQLEAQIANIGIEAATAGAALAEASDSLVGKVSALGVTSDQTQATLAEGAAMLSAAAERQRDQALVLLAEFAATANEATSQSAEQIATTRDLARAQMEQDAAALHSQLAHIQEAAAALHSALHDAAGASAELRSELTEQVNATRDQMALVETEGRQHMATLSDALTLLSQGMDNFREQAAAGDEQAVALIQRAETLLIALDSATREIDETVPAALTRLTGHADSAAATVARLAPLGQAESERLAEIDARLQAIAAMLSAQQERVTALGNASREALDARQSELAAVEASLDGIEQRIAGLTAGPMAEFTHRLAAVEDATGATLERTETAVGRLVAVASERAATDLAAAIDRVAGAGINERLAAMSGHADQAVAAAAAASDRLMRQLITIADSSAALEQRAQEVSALSANVERETLARQMALLGEALQSTAVDLTRILDMDVADQAWEAYLKGDRSIFARRAAKLLSYTEARDLLRRYENDDSFKGQVNRYIHDFEAMLRGVMDTHDGHALAVTLLSSDIGKLYVALAQAIERLRR